MINPKASLNDVKRWYRDGQFSEEEVIAYIRAWNAITRRFIQALLVDGGIRNVDPKRATWYSKGVKEKFGVRN